MSRAVKLVKNEEAPEVTTEILETSIVDVARAFRAFKNSRLSQRAIVVLIQDTVGQGRITRTQIVEVLEAAAELEKRYLKPAAK